MLLAFRVTNHKSFRDEAELSLVRSARMAAHSGKERASRDLPSPVAAIYGANASGKSNLLDALDFMGQAVRDSYGRWPNEAAVPITPFALDDAHSDGPCSYEVELMLGRVRYQYGFVLDRERVVEEWLYAYPHHRRQIWFERDAGAREGFRFGTLLTGQKQILAELTRPNALFLSVASSTGHDQLGQVAAWFERALRVARPRDEDRRLREAVGQIAADDRLREKLLGLLGHADLGVTDIEVREGALPDAKVYETLLHGDMEQSPPFLLTDIVLRWVFPESDVLLPIIADRIRLAHAAGEGATVALPFDSESRGTRALIGLGVPALHALGTGGTLLVDELDTSMHPNLVRELVRLFQSSPTNQRHAQLVFTSHDTSLLGNLSGDEPLLQRDQVWLTEKDGEGVTHLYPLTDFSPRKHENLERGYLQGRYGAVPFFREDIDALLASAE